MKNTILVMLLLSAAVLPALQGCKKDAASFGMTASIGNDTWTFDSLYAWIDTSGASNDVRFVNVGGKDTRNNNMVYFGGITHPAEDVTGTYYYDNSPPFPLPANYKYFTAVSVQLATGDHRGTYALAGIHISNFQVTRFTGTEIQGTFSFTLNPVMSNGLPDLSTTYQMTGQFNMPYRVIP